MGFSKNNLMSLIKVAVENRASDIHIRTEEKPCLRIRGELIPIQTKVFTHDDTRDIAKIILEKKEIIENLPHLKEYDGGFAIENLCRIRYNFYRYDNKICLLYTSPSPRDKRQSRMPSSA